MRLLPLHLMLLPLLSWLLFPLLFPMLSPFPILGKSEVAIVFGETMDGKEKKSDPFGMKFVSNACGGK